MSSPNKVRSKSINAKGHSLGGRQLVQQVHSCLGREVDFLQILVGPSDEILKS